jgi:transcription antitermination factor NusG
VPDDEIETLRRGVDLSRVEPHSYLVVGERVRINAGPLAGMEGVLIRKKNSFRVVLTLSLIMQSVAVELDADDLEPAGTPRPAIALPLLRTA